MWCMKEPLLNSVYAQLNLVFFAQFDAAENVQMKLQEMNG